MTLFKNKFRIESTRLKGYDYSQPGEHFVTINTNNHECLFGAVIEEEMRLSPVGKIAKYCWEEIPKHFHKVDLDEFVIMPNHIHGIITINDNRRDVQTNDTVVDEHFKSVNMDHSKDVQLNKTNIIPYGRDVASCRDVATCGDVACNVSTGKMAWKSPKRGSLGTIIRSFKSAVSNWCHNNDFDNFQWQPRFYEHIIRNEKDLQNIRDYIVNNPIKWYSDKENPDGDK